MQIKMTQFVHYLSYYLTHSYDDLALVAVHIESLDQVWYKVLLYHAQLNVL